MGRNGKSKHRVTSKDQVKYTYTDKIAMHAADGNPQGTLRAFEAMCGAGLKPNEITYGTVINAYAQQGQTAGALETFEAMCGAGLKPNEITYNTVINAYAQQGQTAGALETFEAMRGAGLKPDKFTYCTVLMAMHRGGHCATLRDVMRNMKVDGVQWDTHVLYAALRCARDRKTKEQIFKRKVGTTGGNDYVRKALIGGLGVERTDALIREARARYPGLVWK